MCGSNEGPKVYAYNKTNLNLLLSFSPSSRPTSGAIVDMATYSRENQPGAASKYIEHYCIIYDPKFERYTYVVRD